MRVLVTGGQGMLGSQVVKEAMSRGWEVLHPAHSEIDFTNATEAMDYTEKHRPEGIINCAGRVPSSGHQASLNAVMANDNTLLPHVLAWLDIRLVHMSTDCVFRPGHHDFYRRRPFELPDPDTIYGKTKFAGESDLPHVLNVRGSFVGWQSGLLRWLKESTGKIEGWSEAWWNGTSAKWMAYELCNLLVSDRTGIVHVSSADNISKGYLLKRLSEDCKLPVEVVEQKEPVLIRILMPDIKVPGGRQIIEELTEEYLAACQQLA